jgi:hypothetical protein
LLLCIEDGPPSTATGDEIVEFLRRQSTDVLATLDDKFYAVVDGHVLPSAPVNIYASAAQNNVDLMIGVNSDEGYMIYSAIISQFGIKADQLDVASVRAFVSGFATVFFSFSNAAVAGEAIASHYLSELSSTASPEELQKVASECVGDMLFVIPAIQTANFHSRTFQSGTGPCPEHDEGPRGTPSVMISHDPAYRGPTLGLRQYIYLVRLVFSGSSLGRADGQCYALRFRYNPRDEIALPRARCELT